MDAWMLTTDELNAIRLSMIVGLTSVAGSVGFGIALAWLLARRQFWGKSIVETMLNLPLVLPPVVTGYMLLVMFGNKGVLGGYLNDWFGIRLVFDWKGAALAAAVISFPLMVRAMRLAFMAVDPKLEAASRSLGASWLDTFFTVTLPLASHGIIAGCVLAFARSMGEFGATIMIAGNIPDKTQTIPLYVFSLLESHGESGGALRIIIVSIVIAGLALVVSEALERRGRSRITSL
jgi:molybdate transport system permease protein